MKKITLGGERLGSGKKMKVELHGYERSTFDLSYAFRTTMSAGTLVPFICELALPGDTYDIDLSAYVNTHPTVGPLFGSYKLQCDVFKADIRLYHQALHNNMLNIGRNMAAVKMPLVQLGAYPRQNTNVGLDNSQINPSCIFKYLGISGVAFNNTPSPVTRWFNGVPFIAYWDIYKNYYANKQEEIGMVIHGPKPPFNATVTDIEINTTTLPQAPTIGVVAFKNGDAIGITYTPGGPAPDPATIMVQFIQPAGQFLSMADLVDGDFFDDGTRLVGNYNWAKYGNQIAQWWEYNTPTNIGIVRPILQPFPLENIDRMREAILSHPMATAFEVNDLNLPPYSYVCPNTLDPEYNPLIQSQEGLAIKTYQSDIFQNWLSTEWISGVTGINEITAVSTATGSFQIDQFYLANKIYQMLSRVVVSDGSYNAWLDAVYAHERFVNSEIPTYHGGLSKEIIFQEVISNSESSSEGGTQPLGTLAGKGTLSPDKHKGGRLRIKVDEPAYIIGNVSITPRIDYSQGNLWHTYSIITMDDLHKPALDQIGFQDARTELLAWWSTFYQSGTGNFVQGYYGKQTGWIHYQTNVNRTYGNFAIENNEMFMTLNRRYTPLTLAGSIPIIVSDLTTYIDPAKYNNIFAQTALDAQNFWVQIGVGMYVRRKMSSKVMPSL